MPQIFFHPINFFRRFLERKLGEKVFSSIYEGMILTSAPISGCYFPKILGTYEKELSQILITWIQNSNAVVWVIGCAEGYHAVGLALKMPDAIIIALDQKKDAINQAKINLEKNSVTNVILLEDIEDLFSDKLPHPTHILVDIEGGEWDFYTRVNKYIKDAHWIIEVHSKEIYGHFTQMKEKNVNWIAVQNRSMSDYPQGLIPKFLLFFRRYFISLIQEWRTDSLGWIIVKP